MEVNFFGVVRMTKKCLPHLKRSGGRVVTITSIDGLRTLPGISAYSASKHAAEVFLFMDIIVHILCHTAA